MKASILQRTILLTGLVISAATASADGFLTALNTDGTVLKIAPKTGALTNVSAEALTNYSIGGTVRDRGKFYYVAAPSGLTENSIYTSVLKSGVLSHVDLDRGGDVRDLFIHKKKLFGVFYDGNAGTAGVFRINPKTGVTTQMIDFSDLNVEPIAGAFTKFGDFFYVIVKPEIDNTRRQLLRFKLKAGTATLFDIVDANAAPILCNKFKPLVAKKGFLCLAAATVDELQVDVYRLTPKGKAKLVTTLSGIERVGGGHTMLTHDKSGYYALVYVPGEPNNQHLLKINSKGKIKANVALTTITLGAHFDNESKTP